MNKKQVVELLTAIIGNQQTAEQVVEVLHDEGVLHLGYGDADIDIVLATFKKTFGTTRTDKHDRFAANRLVKQYGANTVNGIVRMLGQASGAEYVPVVNNMVELEKKFVSVLNFLRRHQTDQESEVIHNE